MLKLIHKNADYSETKIRLSCVVCVYMGMIYSNNTVEYSCQLVSIVNFLQQSSLHHTQKCTHAQTVQNTHSVLLYLFIFSVFRYNHFA